MYPKVRVRQEPHQGDTQDLIGLKAFQSLSLHDSRSTVRGQKDVSVPSIAKLPKSYVPYVPIPRVPVTEDLGDCSLTSDSSGSTAPEKDDNIDENKVNIRASSIPRPRAVISSPDNDTMIGNRNRIGDRRFSASKNGSVLQNRHAHCKVKSRDVTDITPNTKKYDKIEAVGKKKVREGSIKSENATTN